MKFFTLAIFMLLGAAVAVAQETRGDISGTVTDPQGGLIAVATVTVTNVDTNVKTQVVTGANGFYLVPLLITGNYQIVAEAVGFKRLVRSGLSLRLGQHMEINLIMEVGAVSESVTVSGGAPLLDTASTRAGLNIQRHEVESMPVFADMAILLTRFVSGVNASQIVQYVNQGYASRTSADYSAVGSIGGSEWTLDGLTNNGYNRQLATSPLGEIVRGVEGGDGRVRCLVRAFHRDQCKPNDSQRRERSARVSQLAILEQPLECREHVPAAELLHRNQRRERRGEQRAGPTTGFLVDSSRRLQQERGPDFRRPGLHSETDQRQEQAFLLFQLRLE